MPAVFTTVDNVLGADMLRSVQERFEAMQDRSERWVTGNMDSLATTDPAIAEILCVAAQSFDLSGMAGVEQWCHYGTKPGWHVDKDEQLFRSTGFLSYPICSIVFYAKADKLVGGRFLTEDFAVTPKTNSLLVFAPGLVHGVEDYSGSRMAVAINPWANALR